MAGKRETNEWGVSTQNSEDFSVWGWGDVPQASALACMEIVTNCIHQSTMARLAIERGTFEIVLGLFEFNYEVSVDLQQLIDNWLEDNAISYPPMKLDKAEISKARRILADLERAAAKIRAAISASCLASEPLALD